jgi:hypothetical protein
MESKTARDPIKTIAAGLLFFSLIGLPSAQSAYGSYSYIDIHPAGWVESHAVSVNARGEVAGYGVTGSGERGFLWSGGGITEILPPGASGARAFWVNGQGDVAGTAIIGGVSRAFLYRGGAYLDPAPGWTFSEALHVGEDGTVAGTGEFGAYVSRNGVVELLPGFSVAVGANAAGQILGSAENTAKLFLPGKGYLNIRPPGAGFAVPRGINESGLVAVSSVEADSEKGFVYSGGFYVFMTPTGWSSSNAMAINNHAQVVGYGDSPAGRRSFLRTGTAYEEISFPGWSATEAVSVNDLGQVSGSGETAAGGTHAFVASSDSVSTSTGGGTAGSAAGGGGCSVAPGRRIASVQDATANLLALFLPGLFLAFRGRGRRIR